MTDTTTMRQGMWLLYCTGQCDSIPLYRLNKTLFTPAHIRVNFDRDRCVHRSHLVPGPLLGGLLDLNRVRARRPLSSILVRDLLFDGTFPHRRL